MKLGAKIFGALAAVLLVYLLVGLLLPGRWEAEADRLLPASPSRVFPFLNRMDRWVLWNPMPESGSTLVGPREGIGSGLEWDDPQYGKGSVRIVASEKDRRVEYHVEVEGGDLRIHGVLALTSEEGGTRLRWIEEGDFGWNPLLGYAARGMAASQKEAMESSLRTLNGLLAEGSGEGAPEDGPG